MVHLDLLLVEAWNCMEAQADDEVLLVRHEDAWVAVESRHLNLYTIILDEILSSVEILVNFVIINELGREAHIVVLSLRDFDGSIVIRLARILLIHARLQESLAARKVLLLELLSDTNQLLVLAFFVVLGLTSLEELRVSLGDAGLVHLLLRLLAFSDIVDATIGAISSYTAVLVLVERMLR